MRLEGRARVFGEDVNTDSIISSIRKKETLAPAVLKQYLFEALDPSFAGSIREGDLIVAGKNFGCGSAMEIAVTVLPAAGIRAVLAPSFARTWFRNAINNGLIPVECDTSAIVEGDALVIEIGDALQVTRGDLVLPGAALPEIMRGILSAGGLVPYVRSRGGF